MKRITLYKFKNSEIKISMEIYFNDKDQLIFDGYDIGKTVEEAWGDSDYEYTYTIEPKEVDKLYPLFGINNSDKQKLLVEIKNRFEGNEAYSKFGQFMEENNIDYIPFSWT
ncbi:hypothetical protein SD074_11130 [Prolixibacter sp. SD074]|nr:hypothetical protein SD074_11130 [Prolixibacter sp. SD074]